MVERSTGIGEHVAGDAELIAAVRGGDAESFGVLYERHSGAAWVVARQYSNTPSDADDVVAEAFANVYEVLQRGGGPDVAFRAYLFTAVRRLGMRRIEGVRRTAPSDDEALFERSAGAGPSAEEPTLEGFERDVVSRAYESLPDRWRAVLWYTEVELLSPAQAGPLLGLSPNSTSALAYRAREGLRQAYLQQHLRETTDTECRRVSGLLGAYARGGLSRRETELVERHLDDCADCRALAAELADVNGGLRAVIGPLVLGAIGATALAQHLPIGGGLAAGSAAWSGAGAQVATGAAADVASAATGAQGGASATGSTAAAGGNVTTGLSLAGGASAGAGAAAATSAAPVAVGGVVGALGGLVGTIVTAAAAVAVVAVGVAAILGLTGGPDGEKDESLAAQSSGTTSPGTTGEGSQSDGATDAPTAELPATADPSATGVPSLSPESSEVLGEPSSPAVTPEGTVLPDSGAPVVVTPPAVTPPVVVPPVVVPPVVVPPVVSGPQLGVTASGGLQLQAGVAGALTLNVTNSGDADATSVLVSLQLPPLATAVAQAGPGWACSGLGSVSCTLASPLPAQTNIQLALEVYLPIDLDATDNLSVRLTISADNWLESATAISLHVSASPARVDLLGELVPLSLTAGVFSTLLLDLHNIGGSPVTAADEVVLELVLPQGVVVGDGAGADGPWTCVSQGATGDDAALECRLPTALARAAVPLSIDLLLDGDPALIPGTAAQITLTSVGFQAQRTVALQTPVLDVDEPTLVIEAPLSLGLRVTVTNTGNATATGVSLTLASPSVLFLPSTQLFPTAATGCLTWTGSGGLPGYAECALGDLAPGASKSILAPAAVLPGTAPLSLDFTGGGLPATGVLSEWMLNA